MPTNYARGRAFEYRARDALLKRGAVYVMRAAQSKGKVDLLALWPARERPQYGDRIEVTPPWLVQAKSSIHGGGFLSAMEAELLRDLAERVGAIPVSATPGKNGRGVVFVNLFNNQEING